MKILSHDQVDQIKEWINANSYSAERDLLLIAMSVDAGVKPARLAELLVRDVVDQTTGEIKAEIATGPTKTHLSGHLRHQISEYLTRRFYLSPSVIRGSSAKLFINRETRGYFSGQSMSTHLSWLIRKSGIDASSTALRNSFICQVAESAADIATLKRLTSVRNPWTLVRYLTSDFEVSKNKQPEVA